MSNSVQPHRQQPTRLPLPWGSPGKNTGVGCHFLLQCMKVKSESEVAQSCPTLRDPMDCSPPGSSVHGIFQARVLERGAIAFSEMLLLGVCKKASFPFCPHRVPDELWTEIHDTVQETGIKTIPKKKKCKTAKWLSEEALQIAVKRRKGKKYPLDGEGNGTTLQYSCLENPTDGEAWLQSMGSRRVGHD